MHAATTDVLIAGAGPTGLTVAAILATENVPHLLLDRLVEGGNTSPAAIRLLGSIPAVARRMAFELAELRYR